MTSFNKLSAAQLVMVYNAATDGAPIKKLGSLTQRYVKRHGHDRKSAEIRHLCGFSSPHLTLRFQDDFWGWNADRIPKLFIGEVVLPEQVDVPHEMTEWLTTAARISALSSSVEAWLRRCSRTR